MNFMWTNLGDRHPAYVTEFSKKITSFTHLPILSSLKNCYFFIANPYVIYAVSKSENHVKFSRNSVRTIQLPTPIFVSGISI